MKLKRILVSQPAPTTDKSPFSELTAHCRIEVDFRPFLAVQGVTLKEFRAQRVGVAECSAVIFTSRKTVDHFFRLCEEARIAVSEQMKYFCVTEAVALYLQKYIIYRKRKIFYGSGTFAALMEVVGKHKAERYLVALTDPYKPEIEQLMEKTGVKFSKVILAHTVPADLSDVRIGEYDLVACYSGGDVRALKQNFKQLPEGLLIATLGNATAREAVELGLRVDVVAPTPKYPSMPMAIEGYAKALAAGGDLGGFGYTTPADMAAETASASKKPAVKKSSPPAAKKAAEKKAPVAAKKVVPTKVPVKKNPAPAAKKK